MLEDESLQKLTEENRQWWKEEKNRITTQGILAIGSRDAQYIELKILRDRSF